VRNSRLSVKNVLETEVLDTLFALPLSEEAYIQFQDLQAELLSIPYEEEQVDRWVLMWGS